MSLTASPELFCTFRLDGRLFGVSILDVREVTTETTSTLIPHAPEEVLGLVNIRGHIHLVLDLRRLLGLPGARETQQSRIVLFKPSVAQALGVIVDEIAEICALTAERLEPFSPQHGESLPGGLRRSDLIEAIGKSDGELLIILNPRRFLQFVERVMPESG